MYCTLIQFTQVCIKKRLYWHYKKTSPTLLSYERKTKPTQHSAEFSLKPIKRKHVQHTNLLGELSFVSVVIHTIVCDSCQLSAPVVLIVNVVGNVFQILHVGSVGQTQHFSNDKQGLGSSATMITSIEILE